MNPEEHEERDALVSKMTMLREQRDQFLQERDNARQLALDLSGWVEKYSGEFNATIYPSDLMKRVNLMKGVTSYGFP